MNRPSDRPKHLRLLSAPRTAATTRARSRAPRQRRNRRSLRSKQLALLELQWVDALDRLAMGRGAMPFAVPDGVRALWLPASGQVLMLALDRGTHTIDSASELDHRVGPRRLVDEFDDDVRVVIGLAGDRFYGVCGGSKSLHYELTLFQCRTCCEWWFAPHCGSWRCQVCGGYDGNAGVLESFSDRLDLERYSRGLLG